MKQQQHIVHDPTSAEYASGLEAVWADWEPALRRAERMLRDGGAGLALHDDAPELLRQAQYRAHTAGEFASGLRPPLAAIDAHQYLVSVLHACRDTLGVLAVRAELDELDEQSAEIGLHSAATTREAFQGARYSSVAAYHFMDAVDPVYVQPQKLESRGLSAVMWGLVGLCAILFTVLLFEVFLLTPTG